MTRAARGPWPGRGENFYRAFLAGYGGLFFAPKPVAGAVLLLGTFAASAVLGVAVLVGILSATFAAHGLRRDSREIEQGLYGFNGALVAFALFSYEGRPDLLYALCVPAAALTAWITSLALDGFWCRRLGLPAMSGPSLLVGFPLLLLLGAREEFQLSRAVMLPAWLGQGDLFSPDLYGAEVRAAISPLTESWLMVALFAVGLLLHSRRLLLLAGVGVAISILVGYLFLGWAGAMSFGFVIVTATPVFVAVAGVFTSGGWRAWLLAGVAVVLSFPIWFTAAVQLREHELPVLTLPFFLTVSAVLLVLRAFSTTGRWLLPEALPLHRVSSPEAAVRWAAGRAQGLSWWAEIGSLGNKTWQDYSSAERLARGRELVRRSTRICVLTGAGISTESGIPDYRSGAVAWKKYDTSHFRWERFMASEESRRHYWEMSQDFFLLLRTAQPNQGHRAIASLESQGKLRAVITQNVDRLHQAAGVPSEKVIEIHGNEHGVTCLACGATFPREDVYRWIIEGASVPYCPSCQGILKPNSIAFGQPMDEPTSLRALRAIEDCDLLLVAGTSLLVQPVATLPLIALRAGKPLILVNREPTDYDPFAKFTFHGTCGALLPELVGPGKG